MRPTRLLITLTVSILTITTLLYLTPSRSNAASPPPVASSGGAAKKKSRLRALFSFHTPLFPPSAIISLTDDNTTFFLARPAAFGPVLPGNGLSGQLWIGSGFGEDNLGSGGKAEGELGCSDVPGWDEGLGGRVRVVHGGKEMKYAVHGKEEGKKARSVKRRKSKDPAESSPEDEQEAEKTSAKAEEDDGTDDYLYHPSPEVEAAKASKKEGNKQHADIQSLQESAEIEGKVVLLSRGGCGFLEKVKWVQRRGGKALIVGDDVRGGPLVTMYARGDTSNVTIPALFTSYTTAHLLSSLIPSGGTFGNLPIDGNKAGLKLDKSKQEENHDNKPTFTKAVEQPKPTSKPKAAADSTADVQQEELKVKKSWLRRFFGWIVGGSSSSDVSRRPPGSGRLDWVMVEEFEDVKPKKAKASKEEPAEQEAASSGETADNFVIGVHDWRDPDLLPTKKEANVKPRKVDDSKDASGEKQLSGGIAKPASGEYERPWVVSSKGDSKSAPSNKDESAEDKEGWLSHLLKHGDHEEHHAAPEQTQCAGKKCLEGSESKSAPKPKTKEDGMPAHDGLWVTLTPTNMSSSPFFDTLLVLVVSPLVTLTVVYALLLLRSRIRRRRWRAPKSVVERLPVRTYHTIASEASSTSMSTPHASSPTTPLLQPGPRRIPSRSSSRSRPRSRTTSEVPAPGTSSSLGATPQSPSAVEKRETGLAEWRRRYGGRQKECVVCLEEYVDGVSRVMSLPCGHEFHAECITPWLTTRRRTCPICKGDVVRSLQRGTLSRSNSYEDRAESISPISSRAISEIDVDEIQDRAATARNDSPSAALPMNEADLERGMGANVVSAGSSNGSGSWREWASNIFGSPLPQVMSGGRGWRRVARADGEDRDR